MPQHIDVPGMGIVEFPDGMTDDQITAAIKTNIQPQTVQQQTQAILAKPSTFERLRRGWMDPLMGAGQLVANALPNGIVNKAEDYYNKLVDATGLPLDKYPSGEQGAARANTYMQQDEANYQARRGDKGTDWVRGFGDVTSPAWLAMGAAAPALPATTLGRAAYGVVSGGIGGLTNPVYSDDYAGQKALQVAGGAVTMAILTPAIAKFAGYIAGKIRARNPSISDIADANTQADKAIKDALAEVNQKADDIPPDQMQALRNEVVASLKSGKSLDAAAQLRKQDFDALNMQGTAGQITRDATQFAKERNLRGVANAGEPLMQRFEQQNQQLQGKVGELAKNAGDNYQAGSALVQALKKTDDAMSTEVSRLYQAARNSTGKDLNVPLDNFINDYNTTKATFGKVIPDGVRKHIEDIVRRYGGVDEKEIARGTGIPTGRILKLFTLDDANKLLNDINRNVGNDKAANASLSQLRAALKRAIMEADPTGGPFMPAVKAAAQRHQIMDAIPALKDVSQGNISADKFVQRHIISAPTEDVQKLGSLLKSVDPDSFNEARSQVGQVLQRAAFGENTAGDKVISPDRFASVLRQLGKDKLAVFFSPQEIADMYRISRVGAYINSTPTSAPVNYSNTAGAMLNLLNKVPGVPAAVSLAGAAKNAINNQALVAKALRGDAPAKPVPVDAKTAKLISKLLLPASAAAGSVAAPSR